MAKEKKVKPEPVIAENADGSVNIILAYPVKLGTKDISEILIKRPKMKSLRGVNMTHLADMDIAGKLIVSISDMESTATWDLLDIVDGMACVEVFTDFLPDSQETGKK